LEIEGGVISSLVQQAIPALATPDGRDHAMTRNSTTASLRSQQLRQLAIFVDNWFDPIEARLRDRVRDFPEVMFEGELDEALLRPRYASPCKGTGASGSRPNGASQRPPTAITAGNLQPSTKKSAPIAPI
jgi:hypothetical protein